MSGSENESVEGTLHDGVLTLAEAASFLRVEESALAEMASQGTVPAQKIGTEWRFLKGALVEWLHLGPRFHETIRRFPPTWMLDYPPFADLAILFEKYLQTRLAASEHPAPRRGSRQAVGKHLGVFQDDDDLDARLADISAQRRKGHGEGGK
jgi:excisionase family DNA binding protein